MPYLTLLRKAKADVKSGDERPPGVDRAFPFQRVLPVDQAESAMVQNGLTCQGKLQL